jgi:hypothetical protein
MATPSRAATAPARWGVDDGAGLLFRGTRPADVVTSSAGVRAYRVHAVDGEAVEEAIEPRLLKAHPHADPAAPFAVEELPALSAARRGWRRE